MAIRKRYNPNKSRNLRAQHQLSHYCVAWRDSWDKSVVKAHNGQDIRISYEFGELLTSACIKWDLMVCVLGKTQSGEEYVKTELLTTTACYFNQDLTTVYYSTVTDMIDKFNPLHLVGSGWVLGAHGSLCDIDPNKLLA